MAKSELSGREFSTLRRRGKRRNREIGDRTSDALFFVRGRTPLHLRMELYDLFDGVQWLPEPDEETPYPLHVTRVDAHPWITLPGRNTLWDSIAVPVTHTLKVVNLDSNKIPSPANLNGIHIDRCEDPSMFGWSQPGMIHMNRDRLPSLTPIHVASIVIDTRQIDAELPIVAGSDRRYQAVSVGPPLGALEELAREWGAGRKFGWGQVSAIVSRLRNECALDRQAYAPEDCDFPVGDFLFVSRRGADYQFATAAALLLRTLGYSTRVVGGFYVDPEKYDSRPTPHAGRTG